MVAINCSVLKMQKREEDGDEVQGERVETMHGRNTPNGASRDALRRNGSEVGWPPTYRFWQRQSMALRLIDRLSKQTSAQGIKLEFIPQQPSSNLPVPVINNLQPQTQWTPPNSAPTQPIRHLNNLRYPSLEPIHPCLARIQIPHALSRICHFRT